MTLNVCVLGGETKAPGRQPLRVWERLVIEPQGPEHRMEIWFKRPHLAEHLPYRGLELGEPRFNFGNAPTILTLPLGAITVILSPVTAPSFDANSEPSATLHLP